MPRNIAKSKPWERQLSESSQAFEAFSIYRDMGGERALRAVAQRLNKSLTIIGRWSTAWDWVERARAYDNDLARIAREQAAKRVKEMSDRHIRISMLMQKKALEALEQLEPDELDENTIIRLITEGAKLERSNRLEEAGVTPAAPFGAPARPGQPGITESGLDWSKLSTEDLEKLAKLGGGDDDDE